MKNIFLGLLAIALMTSPALAANGGGKKKARKKAKTECVKETCCDPASCPKDSKCCSFKDCNKDDKRPPAPAFAGNK